MLDPAYQVLRGILEKLWHGSCDSLRACQNYGSMQAVPIQFP
jgi:hypothetical protein